MADIVWQTVGNINGTRNYGPVDVPDDVVRAYIRIARCTTIDSNVWADPTEILEWVVELSYDGGVTWERAGGSTAHGGILLCSIDKGPNGEAENSRSLVRVRPGVGRQARGTVTATNGPIRTSIVLEVFTS